MINSGTLNNFPLYLHTGGLGVRLFDGHVLKLYSVADCDRSFLVVAWPNVFQQIFIVYSMCSVVLPDAFYELQVPRQFVSVVPLPLFITVLFVIFLP